MFTNSNITTTITISITITITYHHYHQVLVENGDICVVELLSSPGDRGVVSFEGYYDTLRNTRDILLKVSNDVKIEDNQNLLRHI